MPDSESIPRYDLLVSLDRSDRTAALALFDFAKGSFLTEAELDLAPEALEKWWDALRATHPSARIAVAFEQPAPNLLAFFAPRKPAAIYALNPSATWAYRQSLTVSRARNDESDARDQALFVKNHLAELTPWTSPPASIVQLDRLTLSRRKRVDARTALTNQLQAALKRYEAGPADELEVSALLGQIEVLNANIRQHDEVSAELFQAEGPAAERIAALPGAGPALAPRLYVALARHAPNSDSAHALASAVGIAPVTDQSGKMHKVYRRLRCDNHTRQTFVEWAKESWKHSAWAEAFVRLRQEKGQGFHAIIRALAYKWIRILWKCWHDQVAYDEAKYLARLREKGSPLVPKIPAVTTASAA